MLEIFHPILDRVKVVLNLMTHLIFVGKAYIPNFRPLLPYLHVKKFLLGGGRVLKVDLSVKL